MQGGVLLLSLFLNENPGGETRESLPRLCASKGFFVIVNSHFLGLGLKWVGVEDGERDLKVSIHL